MQFIVESKIKNAHEQQKTREVLQKLSLTYKKNFWRAKRVLDCTVSLGCLLIFLIPMIIITAVIFISDPRSNPFFKQERVGRHGKIFQLYKFRTMVPNADAMLDSLKSQNEMDGPVFKIKSDPRITKFGRFLRKTSLDELPQFYNVLKGNMTIIGPRPPIPSEVAQYTEYQKLRLIVTPGITCLWQVQPRRNELSFDEWVELDLEYILHRTLWLDIKIMFQTVIVMFRGEGR